MIRNTLLVDPLVNRILLDLTKMPLDLRYGEVIMDNLCELFDADVAVLGSYDARTDRRQDFSHFHSRTDENDTSWVHRAHFRQMIADAPIDKLLYFQLDAGGVKSLPSVTGANKLLVKYSISEHYYGALSVQRAPGRPHFRRPDVSMIRTLLPFFRQSAKVHQALSEASETRLAFDDPQLTDFKNSMLIKTDGRVTWAGANLRAAFSKCPLFSLENDMISISSPHWHEAFWDCVTVVAQEQFPDAVERLDIPATDKSHAMTLTFLSHRPEIDSRLHKYRDLGAYITVTFKDDAKTEALVRENAAPFRLTRSEMDILVALCLGESIAQIAERTDRSRETIRSLLKRVFKKTNVNRQSELVGMMLRES